TVVIQLHSPVGASCWAPWVVVADGVATDMASTRWKRQLEKSDSAQAVEVGGQGADLIVGQIRGRPVSTGDGHARHQRTRLDVLGRRDPALRIVGGVFGPACGQARTRADEGQIRSELTLGVGALARVTGHTGLGVEDGATFLDER